jgi:hypothetical protein
MDICMHVKEFYHWSQRKKGIYSHLVTVTNSAAYAQHMQAIIKKKNFYLLVKMKEKKLLKIQSLPKVLRVQAIRAT